MSLDYYLLQSEEAMSSLSLEEFSMNQLPTNNYVLPFVFLLAFPNLEDEILFTG